MKRDRAGCYVTLDELVLFEGVGFEILCEKERWATGRVTRRDAGEGRSRDSDEPWSLELNPDNAAVWRNRSLLSLQQDRWQAALDDMGQAALLEPEDVQIQAELAQITAKVQAARK